MNTDAQALDQIYSRLGITETPQIDAALRGIDRLKAESNECRICCEFAEGVFNALGITYSSDTSKVFDAIDRLKAESNEYQDCSEFAAQVFDAFGIAYTSDKSKVFEAIDALKQSQLDQHNVDIICNQICAQLGVEWDQTKPLLEQTKAAINELKQESILWRGTSNLWETMARGVLSKLTNAPTPLNLNPYSFIALATEAIGESKNPELSILASAIDKWTFDTFEESWRVDYLEVAERLVKELLTAIHEMDEDDLNEDSRLGSIITPTIEPSKVESESPSSLRDAIAVWGEEHGAEMGVLRLGVAQSLVEQLLDQIIAADFGNVASRGVSILAQTGECYFVNKAGEFSKIEQLGADNDGVYHLTQAPNKPEVRYICDSREWQRFSEQIDRAYNALSMKTHQVNTFGKMQEVLRRRDSSERDAVSNFKAFQDDVLMWMRALSMVTSTIEGCTHREKEARLRGMVELIETAIQKIRDVQNQFADYHWQRPDIFRSDYPVQRYRERIRELEAENAKLKGEASDFDEIVF